MWKRVITCLVPVAGLLGLGLALASPAPAAEDESGLEALEEAVEPAGEAHGKGAGAAPHGGEGGVSPLTFKSDLAIWTGVVFILLVLVLWKYAWGPIADGLDKREKRVTDEIAAAEKANLEAKQLLAGYEKKLSDSEDEVRRMLDEARRDAEKVGADIVERARSDAQAEHQRALAEIDQATSAALKELAERSADMAVDLAGRIVDARLDRTAHAKLIEQAVTNFSKVEVSEN